jgi:hypothetical protein
MKWNAVEDKVSNSTYHKIDESLNITDFVRILFKGRASHQRAIESNLRAEQVKNNIQTFLIL